MSQKNENHWSQRIGVALDARSGGTPMGKTLRSNLDCRSMNSQEITSFVDWRGFHLSEAKREI
jgi:hypothetical protein